MQSHTKVTNEDRKIDLIEHLNEDHQEDLKDIVSAHADYSEMLSVNLRDIFEEGCQITVEIDAEHSKELFVPFTIKGDIEEKVFYLAYKAKIANGKPLVDSKKQYFEVVKNEFLTKNMLRLTVKSPSEIPNDPGFAYLFLLKKLERIKKVKNKPTKVNALTKFAGTAFLYVIKVLSSKQRSSLLGAMYKKNRYYTIRKSWQNGKDYYAYIDIYIHGKTEGSRWSQSLQAGDIISSIQEYKEKLQHLEKGKAILLADETSLAALGAILEQWKNPIRPEVIVITNAPEEKSYLHEVKNKNYNAHYISNSKNIYSDLIQILEKIGPVETVWGALEKSVSKEVKKYFRNSLQIENKKNRFIGYWVAH